MNWLHEGFNFTTANLTAEATVALYSGPIEPPNTRPTGEVVSDVPVWVVVIKGFPPIGSVGPFDPNNPNFTVQVTAQASVAIDANTGKILYASTGGKVQRFPAQ
jgi:D-alanyl-D-alanine carboxypeptidase